MIRKILGVFLAVMLIVSFAYAAEKFFPQGTFGRGYLGVDGHPWRWVNFYDSIVFEGATNDAYELRLEVTEPLSDVTLRFPATHGGSFLLTEHGNEASGTTNRVTGTTNGIRFYGESSNETGATREPYVVSGGDDALTMTLKPADVAMDQIIYLPYMGEATVALMGTTFHDNAAGITNSVTGTTNALRFEGAGGGDNFWTDLSPVDPTRAGTILIPTGADSAMWTTRNRSNVREAANSVTGTTNGISFEGATANAYETLLTVDDPTSGNTITLPDYTGSVPLVIAQGGPAVSAIETSGVSNETRSAVTLTAAAGWFSANKALKFTVWGEIIGGNADKTLQLNIHNAVAGALSFELGVTGYYTAEWIVYEYTDTAHQKIMAVGHSDESSTTNPIAYGVDTHDMSSACNFEIQATSGSASDQITIKYYKIETWTK